MLTLVSLAFGEWGMNGEGVRARGRRSSGAGKANPLDPEAQAPGLGDLGECFVFDIAVVPPLGCLPDSPECTRSTRKRAPKAQNRGYPCSGALSARRSRFARVQSENARSGLCAERLFSCSCLTTASELL